MDKINCEPKFNCPNYIKAVQKVRDLEQRVKKLESALDIAENLLDDGAYKFYLESVKPLTLR